MFLHHRRVRRSAGVLLAGSCGLAAPVLLLRGFDLAFSMCGLGGCTESEDADLGGALFLIGSALVVIGLVAAPRIANSPQPWVRAAVALPISVIVGSLLFVVGLPGAARWGENVTLFAVVVAALAALVPLGSPRSITGILVGAGVAAAFGDVPLPGLAFALVPIVAGVAFEPTSTTTGTPMDNDC